MTAEQQAHIDAVIAEYMPLYERYLDEPDPAIRAQLKTQMREIEIKNNIPAWG